MDLTSTLRRFLKWSNKAPLLQSDDLYETMADALTKRCAFLHDNLGKRRLVDDRMSHAQNKVAMAMEELTDRSLGRNQYIQKTMPCS